MKIERIIGKDNRVYFDSLVTGETFCFCKGLYIKARSESGTYLGVDLSNGFSTIFKPEIMVEKVNFKAVETN